MNILGTTFFKDSQCTASSFLERIAKSKAKRIQVLENGNSSSLLTEIIISPLYHKTWNNILQHITESLKPHFNVVYHLVALNNKCSVHSFTDLTQGEVYVACGRKKLNLQKSREDVKKRKQRIFKKRKNKIKQVQVHNSKLTIIYVFSNGVKDKPPVRFVLTEKDVSNWPVTLSFISDMLDKPEGIRSLCTVLGNEVKDGYYLSNGMCYVAVGNTEKFQQHNYATRYQEYIAESKRNTKCGEYSPCKAKQLMKCEETLLEKPTKQQEIVQFLITSSSVPNKEYKDKSDILEPVSPKERKKKQCVTLKNLIEEGITLLKFTEDVKKMNTMLLQQIYLKNLYELNK